MDPRLSTPTLTGVLLVFAVACSSRGDGAPDASTASDAASDSPSADAGFDCASLVPASDNDAGFLPAPHRHIPTFPAPQEGGIPPTLSLVTITASNDPLASRIHAFTDALEHSQWLQTVSAPYGLQGLSADLHVPNAPPITTTLTEDDVQSYIVGVISAGAPRPAGNTLYLLFVPGAGSLEGNAAGYHDVFTASGFEADEFAVVARNSFPMYPETDFDTETVAASHELVEAWTDFDFRGLAYPLPSATPWTADGGAGVWSSAFAGAIEIGDVCDATRTFEPLGDGGYFYTRVFDNRIAACGADNACIPRAAGPDYNVTVDRDWYAGAPGTTVSIPFVGWSSGPMDDWFVFADILNSVPTSCVPGPCATLGLTTQLGTGLAPPRCSSSSPALNNGVTGTLTVDIPSTAVSGDFYVILLGSHLDDGGPGSCEQNAATDYYHNWFVGVYVP